jgi:RND family efflux transporter MFP subunit
MKIPNFVKPIHWLIAIALLTGLISLFYFKTGRAKSNTETTPLQTAANSEKTLEFLAQDLTRVELKTIQRTLDVSGPVVAVHQATVKAKAAGELLELKVREGDSVLAGQLLGRIDTAEALARKKEKVALLASAQAQLDAAQKSLDSNKSLFAKGFVSQTVVDNAESNLLVTTAQREAASAQLELVEKLLGDTRILAPISGQVAERLAQPGEKVSIDTRLLSIVDTQSLEIQTSLPALEVSKVKIGQTADIYVEGMTGMSLGRVSRISPAAAAGSRSVPVFIALSGRDSGLRTGLFARGRISIENTQATLCIPKTALREAEGRKVVYLIDADNKIRTTVVETGVEGYQGTDRQSVVEITAGLKAGDTIVAGNLGPLREGAAIRTLENR